MFTWTASIVLALFAATGQEPAPAPSGSKSPVFVDVQEGEATLGPQVQLPPKAKPSRMPRILELQISVKLVSPGEPERVVDADRTIFRAKDRIRIQLASPTSGYAAVAQIGSDGTASLLFPAPELQLTNNRIEAQSQVFLPSKTDYFEFDDQAGKEKVAVFLAAEADQLKPLSEPLSAAQLEAFIQSLEPKTGAKNLRTVRADGSESVSNEEGRPIVRILKLRHD
jgi:Domain of unknown function (DUF4384)